MECFEMDLDEEYFEDSDLDISHEGGTEEENKFDYIVGRLEELVMSEEFTSLRDNFFAKYSHEFSPAEENKIIYMEIFNYYISTVEQYIENSLPPGTLDEFSALLNKHHQEIDGPLFEMLLSFSDFQVFKDLMISASNQQSFCVSGASSIIHHEPELP